MIELIETEDQIIAVDIVGAFGFDNQAELTKYPIEDGSKRADHKVLNPSVITVEIQQTEHPIDDPEYAFADLSTSYDVPKAKDFAPELEIREVQTKVLSPFLLVGGAIRGAVGAAINAITGKKPAKFTGTEITTPSTKSLTMQTYQTSSPRDRGGELADLLEALYSDEDALCSITYRGRTYESLSLVGVSLTYDRPGLTNFTCTFEVLRTAAIGTAELFDPEELAHKAKQQNGKGKKESKAAGDGPPKSVLKALVG